MTRPQIEARMITKSFGKPAFEVLHPINLQIMPGEFTAITGRSGSGKSTLLYILSTLDEPTGGSILHEGTDFRNEESGRLHSFRNTRMGFIFQFHYLIPEISGLDNVLMPAVKTKQAARLRTRAAGLLERFDIAHCAEKFPAQMSGGEQQRVAVARALIMNPAIIFADEPTGNLDSVNARGVLNIFKEVNHDGTTVIMVTHERDFARRASRQIVIADGQITSDSH